MKRPVYLEQEHIESYIFLEKAGVGPLGKIPYFVVHFEIPYIDARDIVAYLDENPGAVTVRRLFLKILAFLKSSVIVNNIQNNNQPTNQQKENTK